VVFDYSFEEESFLLHLSHQQKDCSYRRDHVLLFSFCCFRNLEFEHDWAKLGSTVRVGLSTKLYNIPMANLPNSKAEFVEGLELCRIVCADLMKSESVASGCSAKAGYFAEVTKKLAFGMWADLSVDKELKIIREEGNNITICLRYKN